VICSVLVRSCTHFFKWLFPVDRWSASTSLATSTGWSTRWVLPFSTSTSSFCHGKTPGRRGLLWVPYSAMQEDHLPCIACSPGKRAQTSAVSTHSQYPATSTASETTPPPSLPSLGIMTRGSRPDKSAKKGYPIHDQCLLWKKNFHSLVVIARGTRPDSLGSAGVGMGALEEQGVSAGIPPFPSG